VRGTNLPPSSLCVGEKGTRGESEGVPTPLSSPAARERKGG